MIYCYGSYSKVVRARKKDTVKVPALKIMDKKLIRKENKIAYVKLEKIVLDGSSWNCATIFILFTATTIFLVEPKAPLDVNVGMLTWKGVKMLTEEQPINQQKVP
ncbi:hypothetical protein L2E82_13866 [Cichorium intybus]|uniref:Uncharacterized protein n=1 Tax=Cichorium intybus TaxID=13427 RepID=A0ACB9EXT7_CICIN|nr:hypothetical protein L1887_33512 [Cichorium endivia]KAI3763868.1 hypothetical protein L2E82_13866 [Cichorium intybus]